MPTERISNMEQSKTQPSKLYVAKPNRQQQEKHLQVVPTTDFGFRWFYLLFPFIPTWLIAKSFALLFRQIASSFFEKDDSTFASVYSEDRSNRIAFLILVLFLVTLFIYSTNILR